MSKIISMSLYGQKPMYCEGCITNALELNNIDPSWTLRVYYDKSVPNQVLSKLKSCQNVHLIRKSSWSSHQQILKLHKPQEAKAISKTAGMFWRFEILYDSNILIGACRDADSRITHRDLQILTDFADSNSNFMTIADHPSHLKMKVRGGMWACKPNSLPKIPHYTKWARRHFHADQTAADESYINFVANLIPEEYVLINSISQASFRKRYPLTDHRHFIGQVYDENNVPSLKNATQRDNYFNSI